MVKTSLKLCSTPLWTLLRLTRVWMARLSSSMSSSSHLVSSCLLSVSFFNHKWFAYSIYSWLLEEHLYFSKIRFLLKSAFWLAILSCDRPYHGFDEVHITLIYNVLTEWFIRLWCLFTGHTVLSSFSGSASKKGGVKKQSAQQTATELGTDSTNGVDYEWLPEHLKEELKSTFFQCIISFRNLIV